MSPYRKSLIVWMIWVSMFLVLEMLAVFDVVPWNTLSWTAWQSQARWPILGLVFAGGLFVLILHIVIPGSSWPRRAHKRQYTEGDK